jgi:hypothetical protein
MQQPCRASAGLAGLQDNATTWPTLQPKTHPHESNRSANHQVHPFSVSPHAGLLISLPEREYERPMAQPHWAGLTPTAGRREDRGKGSPLLTGPPCCLVSAVLWVESITPASKGPRLREATRPATATPLVTVKPQLRWTSSVRVLLRDPQPLSTGRAAIPSALYPFNFPSLHHEAMCPSSWSLHLCTTPSLSTSCMN